MLFNQLITRAQIKRLREEPEAVKLITKFLSGVASYLLLHSNERLSTLRYSDIATLSSAGKSVFSVSRDGEGKITALETEVMLLRGITDEQLAVASEALGTKISKNGYRFSIDFKPDEKPLSLLAGYPIKEASEQFHSSLRLLFYVIAFNNSLLAAIHHIGDDSKADQTSSAIVIGIPCTGPFKSFNVSLEQEIHDFIQASPVELDYRSFQVYEHSAVRDTMGERPIRGVSFDRPVLTSDKRSVAIAFGKQAKPHGANSAGGMSTIYKYE